MTDKTKETIVIKIGGALIRENVDNLIRDIKDLLNEYRFIIVHGGGPQIDELYRKMGLEPKIYMTPKGFKTRYTDKEAINIIKMALAGYVNKTLVEKMQKKGINAFGFCGADGRTVVAERKDKIMILTEQGKRLILRDEYSGKNPKADTKVIEYLLKNGYVPVIGSLSLSVEGDLINMDGDRVANAICKACGADLIISLTDVEGIYKDAEMKEPIKKIGPDKADYWLERIGGGMKKKLYAALQSIKSGVPKIIIGSGLIEEPLKKILNGESGTVITAE